MSNDYSKLGPNSNYSLKKQANDRRIEKSKSMKKLKVLNSNNTNSTVQSARLDHMKEIQ